MTRPYTSPLFHPEFRIQWSTWDFLQCHFSPFRFLFWLALLCSARGWQKFCPISSILNTNSTTYFIMLTRANNYQLQSIFLKFQYLRGQIQSLGRIKHDPPARTLDGALRSAQCRYQAVECYTVVLCQVHQQVAHGFQVGDQLARFSRQLMPDRVQFLLGKD